MRGLARESDLRDALARRERLAGFEAETVHHVQHARRQQVLDQFDQHEDRRRRLLGRLEHDAIARGQCRRELPHRHQDREIPRNDLTDHAERLVEVIRDGVVIDLGERAFLRAHAAGEIAEMIDRERDVGRHRFADRLAVVDRFGQRDARADSASIRSAMRFRMFARSAGDVLPHAALRARCAASRASSISASRERGIDVNGSPVIGDTLSKYSPRTGCTHSPPMKLPYCFLYGNSVVRNCISA